MCPTVAGTGKGEYLAAEFYHDLRDNMRRRAETVEAKRFAFAAMTKERQPISPAQSRGREFLIRPTFAERKRVMRIGNRMRGKAAVARIAG